MVLFIEYHIRLKKSISLNIEKIFDTTNRVSNILSGGYKKFFAFLLMSWNLRILIYTIRILNEVCRYAESEMKSSHRRSDFARAQREFHIAKQYFTHPQGGFR